MYGIVFRENIEWRREEREVKRKRDHISNQNFNRIVARLDSNEKGSGERLRTSESVFLGAVVCRYGREVILISLCGEAFLYRKMSDPSETQRKFLSSRKEERVTKGIKMAMA